MDKLKVMPLLSPEEAKAELARKGWTNKALAIWWECSEEHASRLVNNHPKPRRRKDDDAIRGLPVCPEWLKNI
ncbi:hypothetical protein [Chromobacterium haemolyticum]|uniref:hypothetical protein n=1 Tax=Chromobacterium haemolyticum TaxID=394935 RepID=UPI00244B66BC|nr:hypothetical protein [Chromobacterium haemolyticum]MDH0342108.1 hypothetical protein [Chromobacterium haemolyticum]